MMAKIRQPGSEQETEWPGDQPAERLGQERAVVKGLAGPAAGSPSELTLGC